MATNGTTTLANVDELGAAWGAVNMGSAVYVWRFSQALVGFVNENPKLKLAEIGAALGTGAKRSEPYSKAWVSRAIKAGRTVTTEPVTEDAATAFLDLFYGNVKRRAAAGKKTNPTAEEMLKAACNFARKAVRLGLEADEVASAVSDAVGNEETDASTSAAA